jgi:hypothetical protein
MTTPRIGLFGLTILLGACAGSDYPSPSVAPVSGAASPAAEGPLTFYTAGPGDVMVVVDRCTPDRCANPDDARYVTLAYLGMRGPERAVFRTEELATPPELPLRATEVAHLFVVDRPETPVRQGGFIPDRDGAAPQDPSVTEIVVNPVAGVAFGTDDLEIDIASATPARVVYTVEAVD